MTAQVKRQFVNFVRKQGGPQDAAQVERDLQRQDFKAFWSQATRSDGFRQGDAADALAAYWLLNWYIANGKTDSTAAQAAGIRSQVRDVMASNPAFARLNEAQRQGMAEALMLNFVYQSSVYSDALKRNDQAMLARLADAAARRFQTEMGVDLRRLQLTNDGFVKRG